MAESQPEVPRRPVRIRDLVRDILRDILRDAAFLLALCLGFAGLRHRPFDWWLFASSVAVSAAIAAWRGFTRVKNRPPR